MAFLTSLRLCTLEKNSDVQRGTAGAVRIENDEQTHFLPNYSQEEQADQYDH